MIIPFRQQKPLTLKSDIFNMPSQPCKGREKWGCRNNADSNHYQYGGYCRQCDDSMLGDALDGRRVER